MIRPWNQVMRILFGLLVEYSHVTWLLTYRRWRHVILYTSSNMHSSMVPNPVCKSKNVALFPNDLIVLNYFQIFSSCCRVTFLLVWWKWEYEVLLDEILVVAYGSVSPKQNFFVPNENITIFLLPVFLLSLGLGFKIYVSITNCNVTHFAKIVHELRVMKITQWPQNLKSLLEETKVQCFLYYYFHVVDTCFPQFSTF